MANFSGLLAQATCVAACLNLKISARSKFVRKRLNSNMGETFTSTLSRVTASSLPYCNLWRIVDDRITHWHLLRCNTITRQSIGLRRICRFAKSLEIIAD